MNKNKIAIATITWSRTRQEEELLRESLHYLAALQIPVFITDGGSGEDFLAFLSSFPNFTVIAPTEKGLWAQANTSVLAAYHAGADFIFYTEPDKRPFFKDLATSFIANAPEDPLTGIVLAARSEKGFRTFPEFQRGTETTINNCCREIIGKDFDYTYGPFLMNRNLIPYFHFVKENIGWGWRPYLFGIAHRIGYDVVAVEDDFECPVSQREDNASERIHRVRQLHQNIQGLLLSGSIKLED